jgi:hypothetical protein
VKLRWKNLLKALTLLITLTVNCVDCEAAFFQAAINGAGTGQFPGQSGFPVGFAATPSVAPASFAATNGGTWPGAFSSLTAWPGGTGSQTISSGTHAQSGAGTAGNPWVFSFYDFNTGAAANAQTTISVSNAIFIGCRFQSNNYGDLNGSGINVSVTGNNVTFIYSSFNPLASLQPTFTSLTSWQWPSAGAGLNLYYNNSGSTAVALQPYLVPYTNGYQFGLNIASGVGPTTVDNCDFWGFGNSINFAGTTTGTTTISNSWFHDPSWTSNTSGTDVQDYHLDGPGYLNGATPPANVIEENCTVAFLGNNNQIAFQGASSPYNGTTIKNSFISGGNDTFIVSFVISNSTNQVVTDNTFSTVFNSFALMANTDTLFTQSTNPTNLWRRNKLVFWPGTVPQSNNVFGTAPFQFSSSNNGNFVWPDGSLNSTDWPN